jgi:hypothetical protein
MKIKTINPFLTISIIFYLISLTQNAFYVNNENENYGYLVLIFGLYAVFGGGAGLSWLANILIVFSWGFHKKRVSIYFSISALIFGISFLFFDQIVMGTNNKYGNITDYGLGYYLWILSFFTMLIGNIFDYKNNVLQHGV